MTTPDTNPTHPFATQRFDEVYDRHIPTVVMEPDAGHRDTWRSVTDHTVRMRSRNHDRLTKFFLVWHGPDSAFGDPLPYGVLIEQASFTACDRIGRLPTLVDVVADAELMLWLPTDSVGTAVFDTGRAVRVRVVDNDPYTCPTLAAVEPAHNNMTAAASHEETDSA